MPLPGPLTTVWTWSKNITSVRARVGRASVPTSSHGAVYGLPRFHASPMHLRFL